MERNLKIDGTTLRVTLPEAATTRRHPLLLVLDGHLHPEAWTGKLHAEGILPPVITATVTDAPALPDPAALVAAIDREFPLLEAASARWIAGTAHRGISALASLLDHPEIFGAAACLSASFEGPDGAPPLHSPMIRNLEERPALPSGVRLYADYGTIGLDECYEPYHRDLASILRAKGWRDGKQFAVRKIPGGSHDSASWQDRLGEALRWLAGR